MRDKQAMETYLLEVKNARIAVTDDSSLPVKNLIEKFSDKDAKDLRLQASYKLDLDDCSVEEYLAFLIDLAFSI